MCGDSLAQDMDTQAKPSPSYQFGPYRVDLTAGQLRKHGSKVRLAGQPFEILVMLLARAGQVVTREEIQHRLWSDETFVDFENSLNKAVNKLRQALSDSAEQPTFIETLPRRGYRFIAPVELSANGQAAPAELAVKVGSRSLPVARDDFPRQQSSTKLWPLAASFVVIAIVAGAWLSAQPPASPRVVNAVALTLSSRADAFGGIQTDGVRLFFLQRRGHRWELSQMPASGGEIQPFVTPFPNAKILAVSPDGAELIVAPFEARTDPLPLWIMPSVGGAPRRLGDVMASDAAFTPDGKKIAYCNQSGVFEIGLDAMNSRKLIDIAGPTGGLTWAPDGRSLRFQWADPRSGTLKIWEADADGHDLHEVLKGWEEAPTQCCGRWTRDGKYYIFVGFRNDGSKDIWAVREQRGFWNRGVLPTRLSAGPVTLQAPLPGVDSRRLYVLGSNMHTEFIRVNAKTHEFRGLLGGADAAWPAIFPDGQWLAFRGSSNALWRSKLDGGERRELAGGALDPGMPAVQPGGRVVVFRGAPQGSGITRLYQVAAEGGQASEVVSENFSVDTPAWSPDGTMLLYSVDSAAGPGAGLYVMDWNTRRKEKIPDSQRYWKSRWSSNGKYLASVSSDNKTIGIFNWSTKKWEEVIQGNLLGPVAWSGDAQYLYYQDILEQDQPVRRMRLKDRSVERVVECRVLLEGGVQRCGFEDVMPDDSLVLHLTRGDHDVYSLELDLP
jgi:Tol biopolymer transport system component/DNA-binding winged helix-turn-helix (wHTH) protein